MLAEAFGLNRCPQFQDPEMNIIHLSRADDMNDVMLAGFADEDNVVGDVVVGELCA
jgi:hypothetical protein